MQYELFQGDCVETMRAMPDNSVDSIVTDPPYELGFMGKAWDASGIANNPVMWAEALRVLKPGGHLLAFSSCRTQHRMVCAIEDAGFEIRDSIAWMFGSGFPKSLDVSKAIDKANGNPLAFQAFAKAYAQAVESSQLNHTRIDKLLGIYASSSCWARTDHRGGMPPRKHWESLKKILSLGDGYDRFYDEAERAVVGTAKGSIGRGRWREMEGRSDEMPDQYEVTVPATDAARQWEGWGTALKPAHEPICVARKPLIGTVASNVLQWGTGALNIDGCRVDGPGGVKWETPRGGIWTTDSEASAKLVQNEQGRWPANLILSYNEDEFALRSDTTPEQLIELQEWINANP